MEEYMVGIMSNGYRQFEMFPVQVEEEADLREQVQHLLETLIQPAFVLCISPKTTVNLSFSPDERRE